MLPIDRIELLRKMAELLAEVIEENRRDDRAGGAVEPAALSEETALIGLGAVVSSVSLVSFITDVEMMLADDWSLDVTLVSEEALSRRRSPFRTLGSLAALVEELAGGGGAP